MCTPLSLSRPCPTQRAARLRSPSRPTNRNRGWKALAQRGGNCNSGREPSEALAMWAIPIPSMIESFPFFKYLCARSLLSHLSRGHSPPPLFIIFRNFSPITINNTINKLSIGPAPGNRALTLRLTLEFGRSRRHTCVFTFTETKKHSPNTGARAYNTLQVTRSPHKRAC